MTSLHPLRIQRPVNQGHHAYLAALADRLGLDRDDDPHITIIHSTDPVDADLEIFQPKYCPLTLSMENAFLDQFGKLAVLRPDEDAAMVIHDRHNALRAQGARWDFDAYRPHITLGTSPDGELTRMENIASLIPPFLWLDAEQVILLDEKRRDADAVAGRPGPVANSFPKGQHNDEKQRTKHHDRKHREPSTRHHRKRFERGSQFSRP